MTMRTSIEAPKSPDFRNKFDVARSNEANRKAFEKNLREHPEPEPVRAIDGPRSRGGILETEDVTNARIAMVADKLSRQETAAKDSRFNSISQDPATIGALILQWIQQTPGFIPTEHNKQALVRATDEYIYKAGIISIDALNQIFAHLCEHGFLERSGHQRVRGAGGVMTGAVKTYPIFKTPAEQEQEKLAGAPQIVADRASEDAENRKLSLSELAAKARANYSKNPKNIRVL
jgi:hypothetical protein